MKSRKIMLNCYLVNLNWGQSGSISSEDELSNWIRDLIQKTVERHQQEKSPKYDS